MEKRTITLTEKNAPQIFRRCLDWLGKAEVTHKIESVRRELRTERGLYLDYWVRPKNRWWTKLSKAIEMDSKGFRFVGRVENISFFFETAAKMSNLYVGMSNAKREEFRKRILNSDNISPVLMEIDMAAHFWQMGFDLEWAVSKSKGQKIPEFVCMSETLSYDVECKTKTVDAGRMIAWPRFYRLADLVVEQLRERNLHGDVRIVTPDRLPRDTKWQASVVDAIAKQSPGPSKELVLNDETSITISLMVKDTVIPMQEMNSQIASVQKQFTHVIFHSTARAGTECVNPIIVCAKSKRSDAFLKSVLEDLREAKRQLSGERAGIIVCFVPESFREASNESALRKLTESFFVNHAPDSLHGVTFISDRQTATLANKIETLYPSITFHNSRYDRKWGVATDYMARSF